MVRFKRHFPGRVCCYGNDHPGKVLIFWKIFTPAKMFVVKSLGGQKFLVVKIFWVSKILWGPKFFRVQNSLGSKIVDGQKLWGSTKC